MAKKKSRIDLSRSKIKDDLIVTSPVLLFSSLVMGVSASHTAESMEIPPKIRKVYLQLPNMVDDIPANNGPENAASALIN